MASGIRLPLRSGEVRSWRLADVDSLSRHANNRKIWMNLRDLFPHPYTKRHAREYIRGVRARTPETSLAIALDGEAIGGVGFVLHEDVERMSAEIGYWLGERFWGRGLATEALKAVTKYAIDTHGLTRIYAVPFATNAASIRVLEKAGFELEGRLRRSAIKNGAIVDQLQYAFIAGDRPPLGSRD
jgi:[ribosomal protein S5]-alanine N-acetyltransferase